MQIFRELLARYPDNGRILMNVSSELGKAGMLDQISD